MSALRIGADTFNVVVEGDPAKPTLVLCHALGADLTMWDAQVGAFSERFRVVRYDARGHGGSGVPSGPLSVARLGRDALAILDALGVARAHWLGASMGGAVVQWLLVNAPGRVERAVLAATAFRLGTPDLWNGRIATALARGMAPLTDPTMERWFGTGFAARSPGSVASIRAVVERTTRQGYAACCAALRDMDLRRGLDAVAAPVLVVTGTDDDAVPPTATASLLAAVAGARHVALAARHMPNIEASESFNEAVLSFLSAEDEPSDRARRDTGAAPRRATPTRVASAHTTKARRTPTTNAARGAVKDVSPPVGAPPPSGVANSDDAEAARGEPAASAEDGTTGDVTAKGAARRRSTAPRKGADGPPDPMPPPRRTPTPGRPRGRRKP